MNINEITEQRKCTGCMACKQVCPINAIEVVRDKNGFEYPRVSEKCIECGKCVETCHVLDDIELKQCKSAYLAILRDKKKRMKSSSGGFFYAIAKWTIIEKKGVVYGAQIYSGIYVKHFRATSMMEVEKIQGSKYAQSSINDTYKEAKEDLENDLWVLYSGTPCQISGLRKFLGKEYKKLVTIDLVCKGVCSSNLLKAEIEHITKSKEAHTVSNISFRKKSWNHKTRFILEFIYKDKKYSLLHNESLYYSAFIKELSYRESCYFCNYSDSKRIADITIGDSNTSDRYYKFHTGEAVSIVLLNTEKAIEVLNQNLNAVDIIPINVEEEIAVNRPLQRCSNQYEERMIFLEDIANESWNTLTKKIVKHKNVFYRTKELVKDLCPRYVKAYLKGVLDNGYKNK